MVPSRQPRLDASPSKAHREVHAAPGGGAERTKESSGKHFIVGVSSFKRFPASQEDVSIFHLFLGVFCVLSFRCQMQIGQML